ncbi:MAG: DUF711 family protein [Promethearchaeota archaeon]
MRIRGITIGQSIPFLYNDDIVESFLEEKLEELSNFNAELLERFEKVNLICDSKRLCSQPLFSYEEQLIYQKNLDETLIRIHQQFKMIQNLLAKYGINYFSCAMMLADYLQDFSIFERLLLNEVPQFLKKYENLFLSLPAASTRNGINFAALRSGAKIIKKLSSPDPFKNLQFCVSSNVEPNTPFFPAAYHLSDKTSFSLALEMADEVSKVFRKTSNFVEAKNNLRIKFNEIYSTILDIAEKTSVKYGIDFVGMDFSPAPYPKLIRSIGYAIEKLKFEYFGAYGSLIAIALIKSCIPKKDKVIGFSGFMQPVLEDYIIAKRLIEKKFNLDTLLLYSTMCGTGLDCIPLPGDITERELFYILLDVCTISVILSKPLTARLMPIPGKNPGDDVDFNFEYFAKSKVIDIRRLTEVKKKDLFNRKEKFFHFL